jgi:hypothetical protein
MSTHPSITYALAVARDHDLVERAAFERYVTSQISHAPRTVLAGLGSLLIAAGERLGGIRASAPRDLAGAAH